MNNFKNINNDILKDRLEFRESIGLDYTDDEDKKYSIYFDEISERILNNVPVNSIEYVEEQLDLLVKNFLDYVTYWNEKYYMNGFVDGIQLIMGCHYK